MPLTRPRPYETVAPGYRPRTRMALCIFMTQRRCVTDLATHNLQSRLIWPLKRLFTDTDMHDPLSREEMQDFYLYMKEIECPDGLTIPSKNYDMVLDIELGQDNNIQWSYYYACHDTRCLFWLDEYNATHIASEVDGVESPAHLSASQAFTICALFLLIWRTGHRLESCYWYWAFSYWIISLRADVVLIGTTGLCFRSFLRVAVFHPVFMMNLLGSWRMVA